MHVAAIAVSGASVAVDNASSVTLELRRRAATGEVIGVATLHPGQRDVFSASPRRTVELVNRSDYGLANSVWSGDLDRARGVAEQLVAGNSWINAHNVFSLGIPYGGVNKSGLGGGVNCPATFFDYLRHQSVVRPLS